MSHVCSVTAPPVPVQPTPWSLLGSRVWLIACDGSLACNAPLVFIAQLRTSHARNVRGLHGVCVSPSGHQVPARGQRGCGGVVPSHVRARPRYETYLRRCAASRSSGLTSHISAVYLYVLGLIFALHLCWVCGHTGRPARLPVCTWQQCPAGHRACGTPPRPGPWL